MAVSTAGPQGHLICDMNTTPLIDVMLVLLIMFIITVPIITHAVKLEMPQPPRDLPRPPKPLEIVDLQVDFDGAVVWSGSLVPSVQVLESYFRAESAKDSQPEIHLRPDRRAKYGAVVVVLASAQRNHTSVVRCQRGCNC